MTYNFNKIPKSKSSIFADQTKGKKKGCLEKDNPGNRFKKMRKNCNRIKAVCFIVSAVKVCDNCHT